MENQDFEKVTDLLTPKFRKNSSFDFRKSKKCNRRLWWRLSSAAAVLAIVLTTTFSIHTVRAEDIIRQSIENINSEKSYKVEFYIAGKLEPTKNQLNQTLTEEETAGILYVLNDNGTEKDFIELDGLTEIYDGEFYKLIKNDTVIKQTRSGSLKLLDLFKLHTINKNFSKFTITTDRDAITVSHKKNDVIMYGVFSKQTNRLIEAYVTDLDGKKILGTRHIQYGANIPEKYLE